MQHELTLFWMVGGFFIFTIYVGWSSSRDVKTFTDFSNSKRDFPFIIMFTTYFATVIGSGSTLGFISAIHDRGLIYLIPFIFLSFNRIVTSYMIEKVGRIKDLKKYTSFGDMMYEYYGDGGRLLTGLFSGIISMIILGGHIFALGLIFQKILGIDPKIAVFISFGIVTLYSSMGGIRSVVHTDTLQFCMILAIIPISLSYLGETLTLPEWNLSEVLYRTSDFSISDVIGLSFILFFGSAGPAFLHRLF